MGFPLFRVTLDNDIEGPLVISEPGGWDDAKLKLDRNMEFHSLVEFYDQPLMFYGEDNANNGGLNYIRNIEQTQGPDAQITILIEISNDEGATYEVCVEQTLEIESVKETDFYKAEFGVIRNGFWQNFMNRKGTPVDLLSTTDLDGNAREAINEVVIQLPSQKIKSQSSLFTETPILLGTLYDGSFTDPDFQVDIGNGDFVQFGFPNTILDEVETNHNIFSAATRSIRPAAMYTTRFAGVYTFDVQVALTVAFYTNTAGGLHEYIDLKGLSSFDPSGTLSIKVYIQINDGVPIEFTVSDHSAVATGGSSANNYWTEYNYNDTLTLNAGDSIRIYGEKVTSGNYGFGNNGITETVDQVHQLGLDSANTIQFSGGVSTLQFNGVTESYLRITADTTYDDTETEGFYIHEAGNAVTDRIIGRDGTFYSEYLGNTNTQIQNYAEDGCGSWYALTRGLNVRGYSLADKPFFMSFDTYWNGINPLLNLGLGYETLGSPELEVIRIEPKSYFYNPTTSIDFDFVNNIERSYNPEFIFKAIEIGFEKWSAESASGVDDPQSKRVYTTRFKTVGKEIKILSKFIGASLAIEQTRRNRVEQGKDWRLDEDVMVIAMNKSGSLIPELDENFTSVTNLLNEETRYNIRLSVARNFERWKDFFNGCLQWYVGEDYKFASGEGNFDMTSTLDGSDCEGSSPETAINEKGDIEITDDFLFMPVVYTFEHPMTWEQYKTIRENRNNAIGVSRTDENHISCFIMELEYQITHGKATFTVILGENAYL